MRRLRVALWGAMAVVGVGVGALLGAAAAHASAWSVAAPGLAALAIVGAVVAWTLLAGGSLALAAEAPGLYDQLTGLRNGLRLQADLTDKLTGGAATTHVTLLLLMLEGLKKYNDSYGYACGDALIAWLARKLTDAVGARGAVYRVRGGEFAVLVDGPAHIADEVLVAGEAALAEVGDGFVIWCSHGLAALPTEATSYSEAMKLADRRAQSHRSSPRRTPEAVTAGHDIPDDPFQILRFSRPRYDVAGLATSAGRRLALTGEVLEHLEVGAQLRDVGNMAIPAAVLARSGQLADAEWRFVRLHTLVGERLLAANFGMEEVGKLVRSSHERWDGDGYPDGLSGTDIPLGSRVIFVCSAFQDMTSDRAYREALSAPAAMKELEAGAGTQFDPQVVAAFREAFEDSRAEERGAPVSVSWRRMRVLVAEDDAAARFLLRRAIEADGHECISAVDGTEAWEFYQQHHPEVVVSDWLMPGMDGDALCRRIREDPDAPYTYFIMLTALEDKTHVLRAMQSGVDDFLTKPLDGQDLEMRLIAASRVTAVHRRVKQQQQAIQAEVDLAASVQRGLLPTAPPELPGIELAGQCVPAANVGGDYFDYLLDADGRLVLLVADVAGHSMSSALLMAMARSILRREIGHAPGPAKLLDATNRTLFADLVNAELFITAFCAVYDPRQRKLEFANAGHNHPLLRRASDGSVQELDTDGVTLGILEDGGYEEASTELGPGDLLLLYTDGVVEAADPEQDQFGDERLSELLAGSDGATPAELIDSVLEAVEGHTDGQPQRDDVTLVALRLSG
ncbi:MAG TPA: SpoIIE family protein phosphatase [Solirubrobacteraceae bacterium]|nr:SpoIIE family protein phosphatase [Solirubrobacteraceae bacterium]